MAALVRIGEFDAKVESWQQYAERLGHVLEANGITDAGKKRSNLLSAIGPSTYTLLTGLVAPAKLTDKSYDQLVKALSDHFDPKPSEIVERFKFHTRVRNSGETVNTFVSELRSIARHCNFGAALNDLLRDRLVCGINDDNTQRRLLSESKLTFEKALEIAVSMEAAKEHVSALQGNGAAQQIEVHKMTSREICYRCGAKGHPPDRCKFKGAKCFHCGKLGHIQKACRSSPGKPVRNTSKRETQQRGQTIKQVTVNSLGKDNPIEVIVVIDQEEVKMEIDTGAAVSILPWDKYQELWPGKPLQQSAVVLKTYSGEQIETKGQVEVTVKYNNQVVELPLLVIGGNGPALMGRNWLEKIKIAWKEIFMVRKEEKLEELLARHASVFEPGLGRLHGFQAKIHLDEKAKPKFYKARSVPYSVKAKIEEEIDRLVRLGIIQSVQFSDWATPVVPVVKPDKSVRLCGDYKVTVNPVSRLEHYPIPRIQDLFATLGGGKRFSTLDMSQAYQQIELEDESKEYTVINTHKGLFKYNRLPFGISSAPAVFQRVMDNLLQGIPGVVVYLDDVLITGKSEQEHLEALDSVLRRFGKAGLKLKKAKCCFMEESVKYLGHTIDSKGLHPIPEKVSAVKEAPAPRNLTQLKAYLGLLTYYGRFIPNLSNVLLPLYRLLRKDVRWKWTNKEDSAFERSKELLLTSKLLVHFDPEQELLLACDASPYGIGAVLSHRYPDGSEKPIGYVSRTLSQAERNYSQLEREGLACVFGVDKFHEYLFGRSFTLLTDNLPLKTLFDERRAVPQHASSRIQRWALKLSFYEYAMAFRPTHRHSNADALSRLPVDCNEQNQEETTPTELVLLLEAMEGMPMTADHIRKWTQADPVLSLVYRYTQRGWPAEVPVNLRPYSVKKDELSTLHGCILWRSRVIIPTPGRQQILRELHEAHSGMAKMKSQARMYVWWPHMDEDIELLVKECVKCQEQQPEPVAAPLEPWKWPSRPWSRIHVDHAGPFLNSTFLVIVDAYTKWVEIFKVPSTTSSATIQCLQDTFARFGLPNTIVSDNGTAYTSTEFQDFVKANGIDHIRTAPYQPQSNGLAERMVQTFKDAMKKQTEGSIPLKLSRFLMNYRTTPHTVTGVTPAELMFGRAVKTRLDLLYPNLNSKVTSKQKQQKRYFDKKTKYRVFNVGDCVYVRNFSRLSPVKWIPGRVKKKYGKVMYEVQLEDSDTIVRRHQNQLGRRVSDRIPELEATGTSVEQPSPQPQRTPSEPRYPTRNRRAPARFTDELWN